MIHEEGTAECLTLEGQRLGVDTVELMHTVLAVGIESGHFDTRQVLVLELLGLPPVEDGLVLRLTDIHERRQPLVVVG